MVLEQFVPNLFEKMKDYYQYDSKVVSDFYL